MQWDPRQMSAMSGWITTECGSTIWVCQSQWLETQTVLFDTFCTLEVLLELLNLRCRTAFILACLLEEFVQSVTDRLLEQWIEEEAHGWTCNGIASQSDFALFPDACLLPRFPCLCFYVLLANSGIFDGYTRRGPCWSFEAHGATGHTEIFMPSASESIWRFPALANTCMLDLLNLDMRRCRSWLQKSWNNNPPSRSSH